MIRLVIWSLIVLLTALLAGVFYFGDRITFFERVAPTVSFSALMKGVGSEPARFSVNARDSENGIDEIILRGEQNGQRFDIGKLKVQTPEKYDVVHEFIIDPKQWNLREGEIKITAVAFDRSFFSNRNELSVTLPVDFKRARIEVLTPQQNVSVGGTELVFFKVTGSSPEHYGVRVGEREFIGYPASVLGSDFAHVNNVYFSFFAIPADWDKSTPVIFVENRVGNETKATFPHLVLPKKFPLISLPVTESFFDTVLPAILGSFSPPKALGGTLAEKAQQFKEINESYRSTLQKKIKGIMSHSESKRYWTTPFIRPMAGANRSVFFEQRTYMLDGKPLSGSVHDGVDLAGTAMMPVVAANSGKVVFAGELGIYGSTVIIDHGLGLFTLYGHLSSVLVSEGATIRQGESVGRSGSTGLAGGDHLHYEVRVWGTPVTPIEWWDQTWMMAHIENKLQFVLEQYKAQAAFEASLTPP